MYKKLLIGTDGSESAYKATIAASDLAVQYDADLVIFHAANSENAHDELKHLAEVEHLDHPQQVLELVENGSVEIDPRLTDDDHNNSGVPRFLASRVCTQTRQVVIDKGVPTEHIYVVIKKGRAADQIVKYAEDNQVDAIVLGYRGLTTLKDVILGSVCQDVCDLAPCTCIVVK